MTRIGELFAGYGGLGMGVKAVVGGDVVWVSEIDPGACKVLAHRFPDAPNLGDITAIKWTPDCPTCGDALALYWNDNMPEGRGYYCSRDGWFGLDIWTPESGVVEPVDVLTGGFPCQDVSTAGKRAGMKPGTRSGLWTHFAYAIDQLRPRLVVAENVRGLLSAEADSDVEPCPWCVGDDPASAMRALGAVLADLADLGYDAQWCGLRAADVGGCHGRFRVFVAAHPAGHPWRLDDRDGGAAPDTERTPSVERGEPAPGEAGSGRARGVVAGRGRTLLPTPRTSSANGPSQAELDAGNPKGRLEAAVRLLPTPRATDGTNGGPNQRGSSGDLMLPSAVAKLLPTPAVNDMGAGKTPEEWDAWTHRMKSEHGNGNGHGASLSIEAMRLLPTPVGGSNATNAMNRKSPGYDNGGENYFQIIAENRWGDYADAINRWANVLGRPAPSPTETSPKGKPRLSPRFEEWMMGLPDGWITDTPDVSWQEAVRMCGNGVVPQQAEAAVRWLLTLDHLAREAS